jgi:hypothetical protein
MKIVLRVLGVLLGVLLLLWAAQMVAAESGEVVVVTTTDSAGTTHETRLWVVDHDGGEWLRSGGEIQAWYQRLRVAPEIRVVRSDRSRTFLARPDPEQVDTINRLMLEKYGWADRFIGWLFGRDDSIPIRLEPIDG